MILLRGWICEERGLGSWTGESADSSGFPRDSLRRERVKCLCACSFFFLEPAAERSVWAALALGAGCGRLGAGSPGSSPMEGTALDPSRVQGLQASQVSLWASQWLNPGGWREGQGSPMFPSTREALRVGQPLGGLPRDWPLSRRGQPPPCQDTGLGGGDLWSSRREGPLSSATAAWPCWGQGGGGRGGSHTEAFPRQVSVTPPRSCSAWAWPAP